MAKKIMVVEDDDSIRELYIDLLRSEGYEAISARNGAEALAELRRDDRLPCLVLTDFMMPQMNGKELIEILKEDDMLMSLPVVMISSAEVRPHLPFQKVEFMKKPIEIEVVIRKIREYCGDPLEKCPPNPEKQRIVRNESGFNRDSGVST